MNRLSHFSNLVRRVSVRPLLVATALGVGVVGVGCSPFTPPANENAGRGLATGIEPQLSASGGGKSAVGSPTVQPYRPQPTGTIVAPRQQAGLYENLDLGVTLHYPSNWEATPGEDSMTLTWIRPFSRDMAAVVFMTPFDPSTSFEAAAQEVQAQTVASFADAEPIGSAAATVGDGRTAWRSEYMATTGDGTPLQIVLTSAARGGRLFTLMVLGQTPRMSADRAVVDDMAASFTLQPPQMYGIPRDEALFLLGGESSNPRNYDPANGGGNDLVFSGLVTFNPKLEVVPDLAESWDISPDGLTYTFHLRPDARFHDGRPVTAQDVIYSWDRAADPATESDSVLTYLGDIVGVRERRDGAADTISGLRAVDDHTLEVVIDAPKPYFLAKLTYSVAYVVDRANLAQGRDWYRTPNGTGPYKLIRWDNGKLQLYERNDEFYLPPPAIRFVVIQMYAGIGIRMYETDAIDMTAISALDAERVHDPAEPLHNDLREGIAMCTSYVSFDVMQPPFDDPKVRQAFALAVDKQRYIDVVLNGGALPAAGLYPPGLPGYSTDTAGLQFDPEAARQRLAESRYADNMPQIVFTTGGYGSDVGGSVSALVDMWQQHLGVKIAVENLEPDRMREEMHEGHHGQLFSNGWCADYPDPENFADALFHSEAEQNIGNYSNSDLDAVLERARVERDVTARMAMYHEAEGIIVDDAAAIFLSHGRSSLLVKPQIVGYEWTPLHVPIERYLSIDASRLAQ